MRRNEEVWLPINFTQARVGSVMPFLHFAFSILKFSLERLDIRVISV